MSAILAGGEVGSFRNDRFMWCMPLLDWMMFFLLRSFQYHELFIANQPCLGWEMLQQSRLGREQRKVTDLTSLVRAKIYGGALLDPD